MTVPVDITFRGMDRSLALEASIHRWVDRLEHVHGGVHRCAVVVEQPHHHHQTGNCFQVRVDVSVPGREVVVSHDPARDPAHENAYAAVADAFRAARRQLATAAERLGRLRRRSSCRSGSRAAVR
jgi:ribosome-associated translation inhibitor RaiA